MTRPLARLELRLAALAGWLSAAIILVNTAKRAEILPTTAVTQLLAPLAQIFAIGFMLGLYLACRRSRTGLLTAGLIASLASVAALVGVEFVINLVFAYLEPAQVDELRAGPLGTALTVASILFIVAAVVYAAGLWRSGAPRVPLALYAAATFPIGLRALVPEIALQLALVVLAAAVVWLSVTLWQRATEPAIA
jgi:voltage-gated potassium channel Kch